MVRYALNAAEFQALLGSMIAKLGPKAFATRRGVVQLYSGPRVEIQKTLGDDILNNWYRAKEQATRLRATRIDDTIMGRFLEKRDLNNYFARYYAASNKAVKQAAFDAWAFTSTEFMKAKFRHVATAVCGADESRVFRKFELGQLVENPHVKTANKRPMQLVRDFHAINPYEAFRLLCLTELLEARHYAQKKGTEAAWADYKERRRFFMMERAATRVTVPMTTPEILADIKQRRKMTLTTYSLAQNMNAAHIPVARPRKRVAGVAL